ncbi:MAG: MATE family multidrug resistance protein [Myxococcota bacterium]
MFGKFGFPEMGALGAGVASTAATYVGTATYIFLGLRYARDGGFLRALPSVSSLKTMLRLSAPAGLQQFLFAAGYTALFKIVGMVGTAQLAAANVLLNVTLVGILPGLGLGLAAASLVGQALGREDVDDAEAWGWDVVRVAVVVIAVIGLPMVLVPELVLSIFLEDPDTIALGVPALRLAGTFLAVDGVGLVLLNALLGAGASQSVMKVAVSTQWGIGLLGAYIVGPVLGGGLVAIWGVQVAYRVVQAIIFARIWQGRRWADIRV